MQLGTYAGDSPAHLNFHHMAQNVAALLRLRKLVSRNLTQ